MAGNMTFSMIKPFAFKNGHTGAILHIIEDAGFKIRALKMQKLHKVNAEAFYAIHQERPFFHSLVDFISSGPVVLMILEKENAVNDFRELIGKTNPAEAREGSIRKLFGTSVQANAIHGSDSDENAERECNFFFSMAERIYNIT